MSCIFNIRFISCGTASTDYSNGPFWSRSVQPVLDAKIGIIIFSLVLSVE